VSADLVLPPIRRERLESGLALVVVERPGVPLTAARIVLGGGASLDPAGRCGLAHLAALSCRRGTARWTGEEIDFTVESLGAELASGVDEDATYFGLSAPSEVLPRCLDLLADVVSAPRFPTREVERLKRREIAALAHDLDEPSVVADRAMIAAAYGDHPYGHPPEGRARELRRVGRPDVARFHAGAFRPDGATLVVVGTVPADQVLTLIRRKFGRWRGAAPSAQPLAAPRPPRPRVLVVDKPDLSQVQVRVVGPGFARRSADYYPGMVASAVLGGGFTSRLMEAIRVNRGLSYGVRGRFATSAAGGLFFVSSFTKVETVTELFQVTLDETARFCEEGPTPEELERTENYLCGLFPLSLETHDQLAERLSDLALYGLSEAEITGFRGRVRAVTAEDCRAVARRYFPVAERLLVAVGPARAIARGLERFGPVEVIPARKVT
jgi:zinc protease